MCPKTGDFDPVTKPQLSGWMGNSEYSIKIFTFIWLVGKTLLDGGLNPVASNGSVLKP